MCIHVAKGISTIVWLKKRQTNSTRIWYAVNWTLLYVWVFCCWNFIVVQSLQYRLAFDRFDTRKWSIKRRDHKIKNHHHFHHSKYRSLQHKTEINKTKHFDSDVRELKSDLDDEHFVPFRNFMIEIPNQTYYLIWLSNSELSEWQ